MPSRPLNRSIIRSTCRNFCSEYCSLWPVPSTSSVQARSSFGAPLSVSALSGLCPPVTTQRELTEQPADSAGIKLPPRL
jgi:hypothetical protein